MNEQNAVTEFDKGNQLLQEGKLEDAIASYRHAIELNPANSPFHQQLGEALAKLGRWDEAVTAFRCAIKLNPDFSWSHHYLGDALAQQQKWEQAADAFRKGIQLNPKHFGTYVGLGNALAKLGQLDDAIAAYRRASELNPDADWIYHALANVLQQRTQSDLAESIASYRHIIELNPDSLESYHNFLQVQPDNWEVWLKLAQASVKQEQIDDAIAAYRRTITLNPICGEAYHELAETLVSQEQWDEAIASYIEVVKLSPEIFDYCHRLGELLAKVNQPQHWEKVINTYEDIIRDHPLLSNIYHFLGDICRHTQQWEKAKNAYCKALELSPERDVLHHYLADMLNRHATKKIWEEAVSFYCNAIALHPQVAWFHYHLGAALARLSRLDEAVESYKKAIKMNVAPNSFWPDYLLGNALLELGNVDDAIKSYQKALESEPTKDLYQAIEQLLLQNNRLEEAVKWYHNILNFDQNWTGIHSGLHKRFIKDYYNLGIQKAKKGNIEEAVDYFNAAEKCPTDGEIYEQIWQGLNELGPLNETNPYYPSEFKWQQPYNYFCQESKNKYKVILSFELNDADKGFLENSGLSIDYLQLMALDDVDKEKIFIQSFKDLLDVNSLFDEEIPCHFTGKGRFFQQSAVETGYIYSLCPVTGQILRTNQSFPLQCGTFLTRTAYRFVGQEVFYLIASSWVGDIEYIYLPRIELIFILGYGFDNDGRYLINELKAKMISCWKNVRKYINSNQREIAVITAFFANFGHQIWNEFSGITTFLEKGTIHKIDKFVVGEYEHFNIADIFPGVSQDQIVRLESDKFMHLGIDILFKTTMENSYFVIRLSQTYIKEKLAHLMYKGGLKRSCQQVLQEVEEARQYFPILCVQIRSHYRSWLSQVEGTANIIKAIHADFPNLAVVFDGWSIGEIPNARSWRGIEEDRIIIEKIMKLLPANIQTYSASGRTTWETVVWANNVDIFMAPIGAGGIYLVGLTRKRGVMYSNRATLKKHSPEYEKLRENVMLPIFVPIDCIYDDFDTIDSNFDLDWQVIYQELIKILKNLKPER